MKREEGLRMTMRCVVLVVAIGISAARSVTAGDLDPPGPPAPTLKTLEEIHGTAQDRPPSWHQILSSTDGIVGGANAGCNSPRFQCLWPDDNGTYTTVLDRETGLVWRRSPLASATWQVARSVCAGVKVGGRMGWRLPTAAELGSLVDITQSVGLPQDHPFTGVDAGNDYWTNTINSGNNGLLIIDSGSVSALRLIFNGANSGISGTATTTPARFWCVRGPNSGGL